MGLYGSSTYGSGVYGTADLPDAQWGAFNWGEASWAQVVPVVDAAASAGAGNAPADGGTVVSRDATPAAGGSAVAAGGGVTSTAVSVTPQNILYVLPVAVGSVSAADAFLRDRLVAAGHTVTLAQYTAGMTVGVQYTMVFVALVASVGTDFDSLTIPVVSLRPKPHSLYSTQANATTTSSSYANVVATPPDPITGNDTGIVAIRDTTQAATSESIWATGALASGVAVSAVFSTATTPTATSSVVSRIDAGGLLTNGSAAPSRRVIIGLTQGALLWTALALAWFDNAISWAGTAPAAPPSGDATVTVGAGVAAGAGGAAASRSMTAITQGAATASGGTVATTSSSSAAAAVAPGSAVAGGGSAAEGAGAAANPGEGVAAGSAVAPSLRAAPLGGAGTGTGGLVFGASGSIVNGGATVLPGSAVASGGPVTATAVDVVVPEPPADDEDFGGVLGGRFAPRRAPQGRSARVYVGPGTARAAGGPVRGRPRFRLRRFLRRREEEQPVPVDAIGRAAPGRARAAGGRLTPMPVSEDSVEEREFREFLMSGALDKLLR